MAGSSDLAARKRATRRAREKGCSVYIPAELLEKAGLDPHGEPPWYRIYGGERGRYVVTLYREK
jgi:hypothetical protein